jgi:hypothetical protein
MLTYPKKARRLLKGGGGGKEPNSKYPTIPDLLEQCCYNGQLKSLGDIDHGFKNEAMKGKTAMGFLKNHITSDEMETLEDEGTGGDENEKTASLKNLCLSIYLKAKNDVLKKLGREETKKQAKSGHWKPVAMYLKIKEYRTELEKKSKVEILDKRKTSGGMFEMESVGDESEGDGEEGGAGGDEGAGGSGEGENGGGDK